MNLRYNFNTFSADSTLKSEVTLKSNETVIKETKLVVLNSEVLLKNKDSASSIKDDQLQILQSKTSREFTSSLSVISETQISKDSILMQHSDINDTHIKRMSKAISADACIINLNSLEIVSSEIQSHESSSEIKNKNNCIKIAQKEFLSRIKQKFNNNDC